MNMIQIDTLIINLDKITSIVRNENLPVTTVEIYYEGSKNLSYGVIGIDSDVLWEYLTKEVCIGQITRVGGGPANKETVKVIFN